MVKEKQNLKKKVDESAQIGKQILESIQKSTERLDALEKKNKPGAKVPAKKVESKKTDKDELALKKIEGELKKDAKAIEQSRAGMLALAKKMGFEDKDIDKAMSGKAEDKEETKEEPEKPEVKEPEPEKTEPEPKEEELPKVDPSSSEKLKADLNNARSAFFTAENKYKTEQSKISKLMTFLAGDKTKLGGTGFGQKIGVGNEKYIPVEKARNAYDKAYMEYRVARTAEKDIELQGKPEKEIALEKKKLALEESDMEYNLFQAERGNSIVAENEAKSNKRSNLLGKALTIGKQGAVGIWAGVKTAGKVYNKVVDKIDGGKSVTFKIPWGKDEEGEKKYLEHKHRIGKLVISTALAGLTVGGPEMWIRIARSLTIAVGSGLGLNYVTKKHEEKLAMLTKEMEAIEARATMNTITPTEYANAKMANELAVQKSNKRFNLTCYALMGGAIAANIASAQGLEKAETVDTVHATTPAEVGNAINIKDLFASDTEGGVVENVQPSVVTADTTVVNDTNLIKPPILNHDTTSVDTNMMSQPPVVATDTTVVNDTNLIKTPIFNQDTTSSDTLVPKNQFVKPEDPSITTTPENSIVGQPTEKVLEIKMSSSGALETVRELKASLKNLYPDPSKAPENIQHILKTDYTTLTKEWGMLDTGNAKESAFMLAGKGEDVSKLMVDTDGKVILHNYGKGDTILSGESATKYHDKMFDSDHQSGTEGGKGSTRLDTDGYTKLTEGGGEGATIGSAPDYNPENGNGYTKLTEGGEASGESSNLTEQVPSEEEIKQALGKDGDKIIQKTNTEQTIGKKIELSGATYEGKSVTLNPDHKIYIDGKYSENLTSKFMLERRDVIDETSARWFSSTGRGEDYKEWEDLHDKNMSNLGNEDHEFRNARERRLFKHIKKLSKEEGIDYTNKTMTQVVEEVAIKRMG